MSAPAPTPSRQRGPPPQEEEPAIPLEPAIAKARSTYIRSNLDMILTLKAAGKTKDEIEKDTGVSRFIADYPALFKMVMKSEGYNEGSLKTMIAMLERMGSGDLTQHQASVIIGQRLHDVYIKPIIPSMETKQDQP